MKLFVQAILVGIALSTSSFTNGNSAVRDSQEIPDPPLKGILKKSGSINTIQENSDSRVRFNSTCKWSGVNMRKFKELNVSLLYTLLREIEGITDTDCTMYYRVEDNDGGRPFFPFRIDLQSRSREPSVYGIISLNDKDNFMWKESRRRQFEHYLTWCDRKYGSNGKKQYPKVPDYLSCRVTPTTHPTVVISEESTRKGLLSKLKSLTRS